MFKEQLLQYVLSNFKFPKDIAPAIKDHEDPKIKLNEQVPNMDKVMSQYDLSCVEYKENEMPE